MYPRDIRVNNPTEALLVEQALAMARELNNTANAAADGRVLQEVERLAITRGHELMRQGVEAVVNDQAEAVEKKGHRAEPAHAEDRGSTEGGASGRC